jgi:hypothetical protein
VCSSDLNLEDRQLGVLIYAYVTCKQTSPACFYPEPLCIFCIQTSPDKHHFIYQKTLFIIPTDAHYYKSVEMLKQFKVITLVATCFVSRRNHHQGAVLCLAKTTDTVFFCACRYGLSQCYGGISALFAGVRSLACTTGRYAAIALTESISTSTEKNRICSFSQAQDCPLMMVLA